MQQNMEKQIKQKPIKTDDINAKQILHILRTLIVLAFAIIGILIGVWLSNGVASIYAGGMY